jgi:hypothetical protein
MNLTLKTYFGSGELSSPFYFCLLVEDYPKSPNFHFEQSENLSPYTFSLIIYILYYYAT